MVAPYKDAVFSSTAIAVALDERLGISYLTTMAMRLLLTFLALLTGLAAQIGPAQARIRADGANEVGTVAAAMRHERVAVVRPALPMFRHDHPVLERRCAVVTHSDPNCAPPVMLRIDRARE